MAEDITNTAQAAESLASLHSALSRCCLAWRALYRAGKTTTLTADQALELADWFARCASEVTTTAALLGITLVPMPQPKANPQPTGQDKPRLSVIEGGKH